MTPARLPAAPRRSAWPALATWCAAAAAIAALDGRVGETQLALLVVLASALAGAWLSVPMAISFSAVAVLAFDVGVVPPRGSLAVDTPEQAALLVSLAIVTALVGTLTARLRTLAAEARRETWRADRLRLLGDALRDCDDPVERADTLREALAACGGGEVTLAFADGPLPPRRDDAALRWIGSADEDQRVGLWLCLRHAQALGPGSGRHDEIGDWYVPLRGRGAAHGAALVKAPHPLDPLEIARADAQALCDRMGLALERSLVGRAAARADEAANAQAMSNAFLAAISHDYRTPLAAILGAASSLHDQDERLSPAQRRRLTASIVEEARELDQMTVNTLQLARLDAPGVQLRLDWESAEEIVGTVLRHARRRATAGVEATAVRARVEPGVPLLRCDAILLTQMLDNLVDNACKHGGGSPVEIVVRAEPDAVLLAVRDGGPGIEPGLRDRVFEVFQRGAPVPGEAPRRGSGVGLAVCRAIARAHGGELVLRPRAQGGCSFECRLPLPEEMPLLPPTDLDLDDEDDAAPAADASRAPEENDR
jgi:two-component system sensor histidine kinase KdpD